MTLSTQVPEMYRVEDVMAMMDVSKFTVYQWLRSGRLESIKVGKLRRISADQLNAFLAEHKTGWREC